MKQPMSRDELASYLKVHPVTVSRYVQQGMPHMRAPEGRAILFDVDDVTAWLKNHGKKEAVGR